MSKYMRAAATMQTLSRTAMEEASRCGQTDTDLEHLLEALAIDAGAAGEALRAQGVTLQAVRAAAQDQHADQMRAIGVTVPMPEPGAITFDQTHGYKWTPRAQAVFSRVEKNDKPRALRDTSAAVLRELVAEPSGMITGLMTRLGASPDAILAHLDQADAADPGRGIVQQPPVPRVPESLISPGQTWARRHAFVPTDPAEVWALLADPARMPDWDPVAGSVDLPAEPSPARPGATWSTRPPHSHPDGKPLRMREPYRRREVRLAVAEEPRRIAWSMRHPDAKHPNAQRLEIDLAPAPGGTLLTATIRFWPRGGWRRAATWPLRPLRRLIMWVHLWNVAGGIGRQFR
ncbi:MAG: SRPBCC domain-containing protein [Bifidobacteriaceae bacterium]|jgi:uncharacterized protein YndB with AHSA1/START domain|nr:SRPBCC domain-containing protein [Bifidobacteriaceae bacterium]